MRTGLQNPRFLPGYGVGDTLTRRKSAAIPPTASVGVLWEHCRTLCRRGVAAPCRTGILCLSTPSSWQKCNNISLHFCALFRILRRRAVCLYNRPVALGHCNLEMPWRLRKQPPVVEAKAQVTCAVKRRDERP